MAFVIKQLPIALSLLRQSALQGSRRVVQRGCQLRQGRQGQLRLLQPLSDPLGHATFRVVLASQQAGAMLLGIAASGRVSQQQGL